MTRKLRYDSQIATRLAQCATTCRWRHHLQPAPSLQTVLRCNSQTCCNPTDCGTHTLSARTPKTCHKYMLVQHIFPVFELFTIHVSYNFRLEMTSCCCPITLDI